MLTEVVCVVVRCDTCGRSAFDSGDGGDYDNEAHFDAIEAALECVQGADWLVVGDRVTCTRCAEKVACDLTGHDYGDWRDCGPYSRSDGGSYTGQVRRCHTCGENEWMPPIPPVTTDRRAGCRVCRRGARDFVCHVCLEKQR